MTKTEAPDAELLVAVDGDTGRITLNRPRAINALTESMCAALHDQLQAWASDERIARVELDGAGERGLCSGADVRAVRARVLAGEPYLSFFDTEYAMNATIADYPKPYVAHLRGIVMGGGLGVSAHGSRRLVDETSKLAMPETIIGYTPDVGITHYLGRAGGLGVHVALTGDVFGASDALALGLADEYVGAGAPTPGLAGAAWLDECYAGDDAAEILGRLEQHADPDARAAAATIRQRCPFSVAVTLEAVRRSASKTVADVLVQDRALTAALLRRPDFAEGVRAQLVDKDRTPTWQHARVEDVDRAEVLACFPD